VVKKVPTNGGDPAEEGSDEDKQDGKDEQKPTS